MATLSRKSGKRSRITFYVCDRDAARLEALKQQAESFGFTICFRDDFNKWLAQQLDQVEKSLKTMVKSKGGNNG